MNISQIMTPVPVLTPDDTGLNALELMADAKLTELPVVSDDNYIALLRENDLLDSTTPELQLGSSGLLHYRPAVSNAVHPFDALRLTNEMHLSVLPVVDLEQKYLGAVTREGLLKYMAENTGIDKPGGIIVLEIPPRNYTLYEIARICENEDVAILSLQVHANELGMLEVTLKLNRTTLDAVVSSFERYKYNVREVYGENAANDDITDKYNHLMAYINM